MDESDGQLDALPVGFALRVGFTAGGYRVVEFVSRGGQAFVYRGEAPDGRTVAIKECFYEGLASRSKRHSGALARGAVRATPRSGWFHYWAMVPYDPVLDFLGSACRSARGLGSTLKPTDAAQLQDPSYWSRRGRALSHLWMTHERTDFDHHLYQDR